MDLTNSRRSRYVYIILLISSFLLFYLLNMYTPLSFKDDCNYCFSMATGQRISSVPDIVQSLKAHYAKENGRVVNNFIEQLLLLQGKPLFNVFNTACFLLLCLLISVHALGKFDRQCLLLLLPVVSAFFLYTPYFAEDFLWFSGVCNYNIPAVLALLYLLPYRFALNRSEKKNIFTEVLLFLAMTAFGCIVGNTTENAVLGLFFCVIAFLVLFRFKGVRYRLWMFSPGIPLGLLFTMLAPGEMKRLERSTGLNIFSLLKNVFSTSVAFIIHFYVFIILLCIVLYVFLNRSDNRSLERFLGFWGLPIVYLIGLLASEYSMILVEGGIGVFSRIWCMPFVFLLIITVYALCAVFPLVDEKIRKPAFLALMLLVAASLISCFQGFINVKNRYSEFLLREKIISEQINDGNQTVTIPIISSTSRYSIYFGGGERLYYEKGSNVEIARYYGISDILRDDSVDLK